MINFYKLCNEIFLEINGVLHTGWHKVEFILRGIVSGNIFPGKKSRCRDNIPIFLPPTLNGESR